MMTRHSSPLSPSRTPAKAGPVYDDGAQTPVIPLPNPGEGGPVYDDGHANAHYHLS